VAPALLLLLGAVALTACGGSSNAVSSGEATVSTFAAADRHAAVPLTGTTLAGTPFDLHGYRGKVVVLNFWGSWCPPCRAEGPALQEVARSMAGQGVQFIGIDSRDSDTAAANAFLSNIGSTYPNVQDPDGELALAFRGTLTPGTIPSTLVLDRQGRVAVRILGPTTEPRLTALVTPVVAESAGP
jgi:thiol-disulfide isomerase/thioredoxin